MINCKDFTEQTSDFVDGELSWADWAQFRFHLLMCPMCKAYIEQMNLTKILLSETPPGSVEPEVKDELMKRFRVWKAGEDE